MTATLREGFRPDIEGLRGVAILLVVAYHGKLVGAQSGYVGVDVFFVLSGYLITGLLVRQFEAGGRIDLAQFYARRILRLLPASTLVLLTTIVAQYFTSTALERIDPAQSGIATALYGTNIFFLQRLLDYFAAGNATNPFLHYWSLAVEEQFYLVWPVVIWAALRWLRSRQRLILVLAICSVVSFGGCVWYSFHSQPHAYFGTPLRVWEFALGGIVSVLPIRESHRLRPHGLALAGIGLGVIVGSAGFIPRSAVYPGLWALPPVMGTAAVLAAGMIGASLPIRCLSSSLAQWIGARSYAWYLWHWPVLVLAAPFADTYEWRTRVLLIVLALALADVTKRLVEDPFRSNRTLRAHPRRAFALAAGMTATGVLTSFLAYRDAMTHGGALYRAAREFQHTRKGCIPGLGNATVITCNTGDTTSRITVVLHGDSHAVQWFAPLDSIARVRHWRLIMLVKPACPIARVPVYSGALNRDFAECYVWQRNALARILAMHPDLLIIGQSSRPNSVGPTNKSGAKPSSPEEWQAGMRTVLQSLDSARVRTVLIRDTPRLSEDGPTCLAHAERNGTLLSACGRAERYALDTAAFGAERAAASGLSFVTLADLTAQLCVRRVCDAIRDGIVIYRDDNHLTVRFSARLASALAAQLPVDLP